MFVINITRHMNFLTEYLQNDVTLCCGTVLEIFKKMQSMGTKPKSITIARILLAYEKLGVLELGMDVHPK